MSFQGPDPFGTAGGQEDINTPTDPPDIRQALTQAAIGYLRVNGPITIRNRKSVEQIIEMISIPPPTGEELFAEFGYAPVIDPTHGNAWTISALSGIGGLVMPNNGVTYTSVITGRAEFLTSGTLPLELGTRMTGEPAQTWTPITVTPNVWTVKEFQRAGVNVVGQGQTVYAYTYSRINGTYTPYSVRNTYISLRLTPVP